MDVHAAGPGDDTAEAGLDDRRATVRLPPKPVFRLMLPVLSSAGGTDAQSGGGAGVVDEDVAPGIDGDAAVGRRAEIVGVIVAPPSIQKSRPAVDEECALPARTSLLKSVPMVPNWMSSRRSG